MRKESGSGFGSEKGMSPRKAMASGMASGGGNFGVESHAEAHGGMGMHPDHKMGTGEKGMTADSERGAPPAIHVGKGMHPAQAAPSHGQSHVNGYGDHHRGEKA